MQKHIYFGPMNEDVAEQFDHFEINGEAYDFHIEVNVEDQFIRITDAIGRMIPVDVTELQSMIAALTLAKEVIGYQSIKAFTVDQDGEAYTVEE